MLRRRKGIVPIGMRGIDKKIITGCLMIALAAGLAGCGQKEPLVTVSMAKETDGGDASGQETEQGKDAAVEGTETKVPEEFGKEEAGDPGFAAETVFVHVCGAVAAPGVYELPAGARIFDAVAKAGGCREDGASDSLNLAASVNDGQRIYVPTQEEAGAESLSGLQSGFSSGDGVVGQEDAKVNLNTASKEELMTLTGIGAAKAESIIQYREERGAFDSPEQIMEIDGIKNSIYEKIKTHICV